MILVGILMLTLDKGCYGILMRGNVSYFLNLAPFFSVHFLPRIFYIKRVHVILRYFFFLITTNSIPLTLIIYPIFLSLQSRTTFSLLYTFFLFIYLLSFPISKSILHWKIFLCIFEKNNF